MEPETSASFGLKLRIPEWCPDFNLEVNGKAIESPKLKRGYIRIEREWKTGDNVELHLAMPIDLVRSHPEVHENVGCVAIQRGPLVYCIEQIDNNAPHCPNIPPEDITIEDRVPLNQIILPQDAKLEAHFEENLLDGVVVIQGDAVYGSAWDDRLYRPIRELRKPFRIKAIPYYAWNNRGRGEMKVWIRTDN